ncbi:uncharacterized protein K441DRAFT_563397, partial [Cenococcum geophilum 1.58]|uniref:uncharacterized protein n=1 Tax=Cenococcum geophilum 1.58 TaxID=794803 RepID=UPI00358E0AB0
KAFKEIKNRLISSLILRYYNLNLKLILEMDASNRYPIAFFLKIIDLAKYNYKVYNKEMLAII